MKRWRHSAATQPGDRSHYDSGTFTKLRKQIELAKQRAKEKWDFESKTVFEKAPAPQYLPDLNQPTPIPEWKFTGTRWFNVLSRYGIAPPPEKPMTSTLRLARARASAEAAMAAARRHQENTRWW